MIETETETGIQNWYLEAQDIFKAEVKNLEVYKIKLVIVYEFSG